MPSPFPGMDPYLEVRGRWPNVHASLISSIREDLREVIRPKYVAHIQERIQLTNIQQGYYPDVLLLKQPPTPFSTSATRVADEPQTFALIDESYHVPYIEIISVESGEVVTVIELLSPANKSGKGRVDYIEKQEELLETNVNLVEIDLLGYGRNTVLARRISTIKPDNWRYIISISRANQRRKLQCYAMSIEQRLPRCLIPLREPDPDVVLDLPSAFNKAYTVGDYDILIDYSVRPPILLSDVEAIPSPLW